MAGILIVDDDMDIVEAISMVLEEEGYEVSSTTGAVDAAELARRRRPDLMLVDYRMPGVDVGALVAALRKEAPRSLIALCTAADAAEDRARETGADLVLAKPFQIDELLALARRAQGAQAEPAVTPP